MELSLKRNQGLYHFYIKECPEININEYRLTKTKIHLPNQVACKMSTRGMPEFSNNKSNALWTSEIKHFFKMPAT